MRFASVYKGFEDVGDFEREVVRAPEDAPRPKPRGRADGLGLVPELGDVLRQAVAIDSSV